MVPGQESVVGNGKFLGQKLNQIIDRFGPDLLGKKVFEKHGNQFPLLLKLIDAKENLSIQVHPPEGSPEQKTEAWYIIDSDPGSTLISGFKGKENVDSFLTALEKGELENHLNQDPVSKDDLFFLPSGRIHTIGKGLLLAEIQQSSDTTYRIYDFDRKDVNGEKRELHLEQGVKALDFSQIGSNRRSFPDYKNEEVILECPYFVINRIFIESRERKRVDLHKDSFSAFMVLKGSGQLISNDQSFDLKKGQSFLIPANISEIEILSSESLLLLQTWIP